MRKILMASAVFFSVSTPVWAEADVTGNLTFTSDYVFRGFSQTDESAAIQGGFDVTHPTGLHAGVWASNVDFNNAGDGSAEIDFYGGYANEVGALSYDVGGIYYYYPGAESNLNYDFWEVYINGSYDFDVVAVNAGVNYSPEFYGDTGDAVYYYAGVDMPLPEGFMASAHIGRQEIDQSQDYTDWSLGASKTWLEFDWGVTYHDTNIDSDLSNARVVLSVGKEF